MPYFYDEHRIDDPRYRTPAERAAGPTTPEPMTIDGRTAEQDAAARAQQQFRPATDPPLSAVDAASACYDTLRKIPQDQRAHNADVDRRAEHMRREYGVEDDKVARFIAEERAKFADTAPALMPDAARSFMAEQQTAASQKVDEVRAGLSPRTDDVAALLHQQQIWARERPKLDAKADKGTAAQAAVGAIANAPDLETLRVYAAELPSYLAARGVDDTTFVERALTDRVPELAAAREQQHEAAHWSQVVEHTAGYVDRCIASGRPADPRVLAMLDPKKIRKRELLGRR